MVRLHIPGSSLCLGAVIACLGQVATGGDLRIGPATLEQLPPGSAVHESIRVDAGGLSFSAGGIELPLAGLLSPTAGAVDLRCQTPEDWPAAADRNLFHLAAGPHQHVTLFFRNAGLVAVYKGGEAHFSSISYPAAGSWKPGEWHRVQFGWQGSGDTVQFLLLVDGQLAGMAEGRRLPVWPSTCELGSRAGRSPWRGRLADIVFSTAPVPIPGLEPGERTITVRGDREMGACYAFWTVGNFNKPQEFLNPAYAQAAKRSRPFVHQANAVYLLGGRYRDANNWFLGLGPDGEVRSDFTGLVAQLRAMLAGGFVPWPVLDNVPYDLSSPAQENTYGNTAPAADVRAWGRYVEAAVRAMVDACGRDTVAGWWFRVGTEPDLTPGHWAGTREQYFEHYDHTVAALDRVLPEAKVGPGNILNPAGGELGATTRRQWGLDIIDHAATGINQVTGQRGTRMDWFSFSWYGQVGQPTSGFDDAVNAVRRRLAPYPQFAELPLIVGEFAILHDEGGRRLWAGDTTEWGASFYAALADRVYRHGIRQVNEWAQTTAGVPHARTRVIGMLQDMVGGRRLAVDVQATSQADCGAIACRQGADLLVLLYNHRPLRTPKVAETVRLRLDDARLQAGTAWRLSEWRIDADHGQWGRAFEADCAAAGVARLPGGGRYEGAITYAYGEAGAALFRQNLATYDKLSTVPKTRDREAVPVADGRCAIDLVMPGHSAYLIRLSPQ